MLDKIKDKLKHKMCHITLKQALIIYILTALVVAFLCSIVMIIFFENWKNIIYQVSKVQKSISYGYNDTLLPKAVKKQIMIVNVLEILSIIVSVLISVIWVSHQYYKKRLEEPLKILQTEMQFLARDDLSFECSYISGDEMEEICHGFNEMRGKILENKKNLRDLMEVQRKLNSVFAHDIRTPLTVMKGYTQMLLNYYTTGKISEEKMLETLQTLDRQVNRMEQFAATMKQINTIEEWEILRKPKDLQELLTNIKRNVEGMSEKENLICFKAPIIQSETIICDEYMIQEVIDNLVTNALRYAKSSVNIRVKEEEALYFYIKDDGQGFTKEELEKATRPYYSTMDGHFGLGLTICQTLCKKHGGDLEIMNSIEGGAVACAYFYVR